jgi:hypothetical protein
MHQFRRQRRDFAQRAIDQLLRAVLAMSDDKFDETILVKFQNLIKVERHNFGHPLPIWLQRPPGPRPKSSIFSS